MLIVSHLFLDLFLGRPGTDVFTDNGVNRITRHQPRQNEVKDYRGNKGNDKPENLLFEVFLHSLGHRCKLPSD